MIPGVGTFGEHTVNSPYRKQLKKLYMCVCDHKSVTDYFIVNKKLGSLVQDASIFRRSDNHSYHILVIGKIAILTK